MQGGWRAEERRNAQLVMPNLYIGPMSQARDADWLRDHVRHVVIIRVQAERNLVRPFYPDLVTYTVYDVHSFNGTDNFLEFVPQFTELLSQTLPHGGVLVHCNTGLQLSPALVAAFLMRAHGMGWSQARDCVREARCCAHFSPVVEYQLREYELTLQCQKQVRPGPGQGSNELELGKDVVHRRGRGVKRGCPDDDPEVRTE